ncbi:hypothetical protein MWU54_04730 [Marivita sp. S6314]|uniref:hypothetical protein n=1 Tax=Marivita sp. S6314 TaxID=2926406 RepID=UPI001FF43EAE|nr:hypothetical protein [Marivita sp. S6314]MCK0149317.1 hypothetical protein [Marivita sp. S6314]
MAHVEQHCIDRYAGPYERWVFTKELGRPYAFPLIARGPSKRYTALMEGGAVSALNGVVNVRVPPLWEPDKTTRHITPFVFEDDAPQNDTDAHEDTSLARCLGSLRTCMAASQDAASTLPARFRVNFPVVDETWVQNYDPDGTNTSWSKPLTQPKAIIAVIDDGLPFAHRAFLDSHGHSRMSYCWLQSGIAADTANVPFGREYTNAEIDQLRRTYGRDETALYRAAAAIDSGVSELGDHLRRSATHGSHILGLAAGNDSLFLDHILGDDIQIIAVQLPNTIAWDTSGFGKEMYMLSAMHYVFERASRIACAFGIGELPLILNFSYGWSAGRHDGASEMEIAVRDLLDARQAIQPVTEIVMPTGNNFASDMHARMDETSFHDHSARIHWQIQPDDQTSSYLELWFPAGFDPSDYHLSLTPPAGTSLDQPVDIAFVADPALDDDGDPRRFVEVISGGKIIGQMSVDKHRRDRWRGMIAVIPTVYTRHQDRRLASGAWTVTLSRSENAMPLSDDQDILIWVQRDDDPSDLKSNGRQSYLVEIQDAAVLLPKPPQSPVQDIPENIAQVAGYGALNAVASTPSTTRVAGYTAQTGRISPYSGAGGLRTRVDGTVEVWGAQADLTAVSDHSPTLPGISSIGVLSGARARLVGTSCAAPSAARIMVCNAAAGRDVFDGFGDPLDLYRTESSSPSVESQHKARVGHRTAPPVSKGG